MLSDIDMDFEKLEVLDCIKLKYLCAKRDMREAIVVLLCEENVQLISHLADIELVEKSIETITDFTKNVKEVTELIIQDREKLKQRAEERYAKQFAEKARNLRKLFEQDLKGGATVE